MKLKVLFFNWLWEGICMNDIKKYVKDFLKQLQKEYQIVKSQISVLCDDAKSGIYLSRNEFERTLDILLDYSLHLNVEEEFEPLCSMYIEKYLDSIESYKKYMLTNY